MYCPKCGSVIPPGQTSCASCGWRGRTKGNQYAQSDRPTGSPALVRFTASLVACCSALAFLATCAVLLYSLAMHVEEFADAIGAYDPIPAALLSAAFILIALVPSTLSLSNARRTVRVLLGAEPLTAASLQRGLWGRCALLVLCGVTSMGMWLFDYFRPSLKHLADFIEVSAAAYMMPFIIAFALLVVAVVLLHVATAILDKSHNPGGANQ